MEYIRSWTFEDTQTLPENAFTTKDLNNDDVLKLTIIDIIMDNNGNYYCIGMNKFKEIERKRAVLNVRSE